MALNRDFNDCGLDGTVKRNMKETKQKNLDSNMIKSQFESNPYLVFYDRANDDIIKFIKANANEKQNILDVGGGNGNTLDNVIRYTPIKRLYNLEITPRYAKYQLNENIIFLNGSVTQLPFKDNAFDFVVLWDVLHHLIGSSRKKSKDNCRVAISEVMRVTKTGGYICMSELYIKYSFFSGILFYLLRFLQKFGITIKYFGVNEGVIICPLTPSEIESLLVNNRYDIELKHKKINRHFKGLKFKITVLMSNSGSAYFIGKINNGEK